VTAAGDRAAGVWSIAALRLRTGRAAAPVFGRSSCYAAFSLRHLVVAVNRVGLAAFVDAVAGIGFSVSLGGESW